jgi:hypothetical protein
VLHEGWSTCASAKVVAMYKVEVNMFAQTRLCTIVTLGSHVRALLASGGHVALAQVANIP